MALSSFQRKIVQRFRFLRLSPPGDRWCDALGFVPAGSVSSYTAIQLADSFKETKSRLIQGWFRSWLFVQLPDCFREQVKSGIYVRNLSRGTRSIDDRTLDKFHSG